MKRREAQRGESSTRSPSRAVLARSSAAPARAATFVALAAASLGLPGCVDEGGVVTGVIHIEALRASDQQPAADLPSDNCERFPVLPGGRRDVQYPIEGNLGLRVALTRDEVVLRFAGAESGRPERLDRDDLSGQLAIEVVAAATGERFTVILSESCPSD